MHQMRTQRQSEPMRRPLSKDFFIKKKVKIKLKGKKVGAHSKALWAIGWRERGRGAQSDELNEIKN